MIQDGLARRRLSVNAPSLRRKALPIATLAIVVSVATGALASSDFSDAAQKCVQPQAHRIASGTGPDLRPWTVTARIDNVAGCEEWLLGVKVSPIGLGAGTWRKGWAIQAHGRLPEAFTLAGVDESAGSERVFSGVVGERIETVVARTSSGVRLKIRPRLPSQALRQRFEWLRGLRYFVRFYQFDQTVRVARLLDARGRLVKVMRGFEGEFE